MVKGIITNLQLFLNIGNQIGYIMVRESDRSMDLNILDFHSAFFHCLLFELHDMIMEMMMMAVIIKQIMV